jgi:hypothetical protein
VALGVSTVAYLVFYVVVGTGSRIGLVEIGVALLVALVAAAAVLAVVLVAVGLLHLLGVSNAWAALGLAFGLVAVVLGIIYAGIAASMQPGDEGWNMLFLVEAAVVPVPTWLTYAVGLLVGDLRRRAARNRLNLTA